MLLQPIQSAITSLKKNKSQTALTILGVVIGITAVITVLSAGQAIKGLIVGEIEAFGSNFIEIEVKTPNTSQASTENAFSMVGGSIITTLKLSDAEKISKNSNVNKYYAGVLGQKLINYESVFKKTLIMGVSADFIDIDTSEMEAGNFFTEQDDQSLNQVVVIGHKLRDDLFGLQDPIGQRIKIGNEKFKVIGYLKEKGPSITFNMDEMVFMPIKTLQKRLLGIDYVSYIIVQLKDSSIATDTAKDFEIIMRQAHNITDPNKDDFAVTTMEQMMEMLNIVIYGIQILLIALGSISLIVGGVGIMNIMYVSVTERTFEIGLRKAIGAKNKDILWQFLAEAIIITLTGGIFGIIFGVILSYIISIVATNFGLTWAFAISWNGLILAVFMSIIVGLLFGIYPAKQASQKDPIDSLRHE